MIFKNIILIVIYFSSINQVLGDAPREENIVSKVGRVLEYGHLAFYGETRFIKLWGVDPDVHFLRELVEGKNLECVILGEVYLLRRQTVVVRCYPFDIADRNPSITDGMELSEFLVKSGHGREICVETLNEFGTCRGNPP